MDKFGVLLNLEYVAVARKEWDLAKTRFDADVEYVMRRLLHEAARNYMSVDQVAGASGMTQKQVRKLMRDSGLNPKDSKRLLGQKAAEVLAENAELLGVDPHEMDLMSPLAYLPMGDELRSKLQEQATAQVHEVSGNEFDETGDKMRDGLVDDLIKNGVYAGDDGALQALADALLAAGWHK